MISTPGPSETTSRSTTVGRALTLAGEGLAAVPPGLHLRRGRSERRADCEGGFVRTRWMAITMASIIAALGFRQAQRRLNPVVELLAQKKPVFGLYAPSN